MSRLQIEKQVLSSLNGEFGTKAFKSKQVIGTEGTQHEFDIYQPKVIIGGISTSPWLNKSGTNNTAGQDRVAAEILWLSLWPGNERRVLVLTNEKMAENIFQRFAGCPFPHPIEIFFFDLKAHIFHKKVTL